jgi:hypothetical protein
MITDFKIFESNINESLELGDIKKGDILVRKDLRSVVIKVIDCAEEHDGDQRYDLCVVKYGDRGFVNPEEKKDIYTFSRYLFKKYKDPVRKITEEDPYGEEDWGEEYERFWWKKKNKIQQQEEGIIFYPIREVMENFIKNNGNSQHNICDFLNGKLRDYIGMEEKHIVKFSGVNLDGKKNITDCLKNYEKYRENGFKMKTGGFFPSKENIIHFCCYNPDEKNSMKVKSFLINMEDLLEMESNMKITYEYRRIISDVDPYGEENWGIE